MGNLDTLGKTAVVALKSYKCRIQKLLEDFTNNDREMACNTELK